LLLNEALGVVAILEKTAVKLEYAKVAELLVRIFEAKNKYEFFPPGACIGYMLMCVCVCVCVCVLSFVSNICVFFLRYVSGCMRVFGVCLCCIFVMILCLCVLQF